MTRPHDAQAQIRTILDTMADGLLVVDEDGLVRYANAAAGAMLGRPGESLLGQPFGLPVVVGEASEIDLIADDGSARVAEMRAVPVEWDGQPAALAALRDITERRQAEEARHALVREQAARASAEEAVKDRDTFLSVAAHELKTPITSMTVAVQLLLRMASRPEAVPPDVLMRHLGTINQQARKLAEMVDRVLDVSRVQMGRLILDREPTDVSRLVENAVALVRPKAGARTFVVRNAAGGPVVAEVDPLRLEQVLTNLLDNGVKYSPDGSAIEIDLSLTDDKIDIAVRDHGLGIAIEHREKIFERFYQAHDHPHAPGLGLGLYICKQIVELHGGTIEALGPADGGTVVRVRLPMTASA